MSCATTDVGCLYHNNLQVKNVSEPGIKFRLPTMHHPTIAKYLLHVSVPTSILGVSKKIIITQIDAVFQKMPRKKYSETRYSPRVWGLGSNLRYRKKNFDKTLDRVLVK